MGALEHMFTKDQLDQITEWREKETKSWSEVTKLFNDSNDTTVTIDEIRWAYSNLC
jgi:hypothetical protein